MPWVVEPARPTETHRTVDTATRASEEEEEATTATSHAAGAATITRGIDAQPGHAVRRHVHHGAMRSIIRSSLYRRVLVRFAAREIGSRLRTKTFHRNCALLISPSWSGPVHFSGV